MLIFIVLLSHRCSMRRYCDGEKVVLEILKGFHSGHNVMAFESGSPAFVLPLLCIFLLLFMFSVQFTSECAVTYILWLVNGRHF
jgi:hypothetical protein